MYTKPLKRKGFKWDIAVALNLSMPEFKHLNMQIYNDLPISMFKYLNIQIIG